MVIPRIKDGEKDETVDLSLAYSNCVAGGVSLVAEKGEIQIKLATLTPDGQLTLNRCNQVDLKELGIKYRREGSKSSGYLDAYIKTSDET